MLDLYTDGVWLVELAPLGDPGHVPGAVAGALGIALDPLAPPLRQPAEALRPKQMLLVLDNCEHLVAACAQLADALLQVCPQVQLLATSREALGTAGERTWRVPSLLAPDVATSGPESTAAPPVDALTQYDAVRLFVERAVAFVGGFTLEAAELVCADGPGEAAYYDWQAADGARSTGAGRAPPDVDQREVLDLLTALADKSLVQSETRGGAARYRLLEIIRLYGRERLQEASESDATRDRHLTWCLRLVLGPHPADDAAFAIQGPGGRDMRPFALEHDNLRAALAWALDRDARAGLRLAVGLGFGWALAHLAPDVGEWLDRLLYRVPERDDLRAWGLLCSATARRMCGAIEAARDHLEACGAYFRETGNRLGIAWSADGYGLIAAAEGEPARARAWFETSLAAFRELVYPWPGAALRNVALCAMRQGDDARAARRSRRPWPSPVARRMRGRPGAP